MRITGPTSLYLASTLFLLIKHLFLLFALAIFVCHICLQRFLFLCPLLKGLISLLCRRDHGVELINNWFLKSCLEVGGYAIKVRGVIEKFHILREKGKIIRKYNF